MNNNLDKKKVVLGLSGGVDSATAALLLKQAGYEVTGLYFVVFENNEEGRLAAEKTAKEAGIDFVYVNVSDDFEHAVVDRFCSEYLSGRTPNPCVMCNPAIKFRTLIDYADEIGAYYIATGHYGTTVYDEELDCWFIRRGSNDRKDQTYMLYRLSEEVIKRFLMPLDGYDSKDEIRRMAEEGGLSNSKAKDSQEICFIDSDSDYISFLTDKGYVDGFKKGPYVDKEGNTIGEHQGIARYTVGQRKGLGQTFGKPMFVLGVDKDRNAVVLGDNSDLFNNTVYSTDNFFTLSGGNDLPLEYAGKKVMGKIRYAARPAECELSMEDGVLKAVFTEPQRAATPGQSVVFYDGERLIGGGYILKSE